MRKLFPAVVCTGLLAVACSGGNDQLIPTFPSQAIASPIPAPRPPFAFAEPYTAIAVGEMVTSRVTADDPSCAEFPEFRCQYFRLTVPGNGHVDAAVTAIRAAWVYGLDLSVTDSSGGERWGQTGGQSTIAARAGDTIQFTVWYATPGDEFELRTSLRPD